MKKLLLTGLTALTLVITGCTSDEMEYIPFKSSSSGNWGLINAKGDVKFEGEFKNRITAASHGAFFAKNNDGDWLLYSSNEKTIKELGGPYYEVGAFISDVAPVVKKGEKITLINPKGEVKVELDKIESKSVRTCRNFFEGYAVVSTEDGYGVIDTSGKVIIKPGYSRIYDCSDGMFIAIDKDDKNYVFLDKSGKVTATLSREQYQLEGAVNANYYAGFSDGVVAMQFEATDGTSRIGLMGADGKWVLDPTSRIREVEQIVKGKIVYRNDDGKRGVMDFKGEPLIVAKFRNLGYACDGDVLASVAEDADFGFLLDKKGEVIEGTSFPKNNSLKVFPFFNKVLFIEKSDDLYTMFDTKGRVIETKTPIVRLPYPEDILGDTEIESQFVDLEELLTKLNITEQGIEGLNLQMGPKEAIKGLRMAIAKLENKSKEELDTIGSENIEASNYSYNYDISDNTGLNAYKAYVYLTVTFPERMAYVSGSYTNWDTDSWGYSYYTTVNEYSFSNTKAGSVTARVVLHDDTQAKKFFELVKGQLSKFGKAEGGDGKTTVKSGDATWTASYEYDTVCIILAKENVAPVVAYSDSAIDTATIITEAAIEEASTY